VVGHDPEGPAVRIVAPGQRCHGGKHRRQQIDVEDLGGVRRRHGQALQASPEVDVGLGQGFEALGRPPVLHEDRVADLHEPPAVAVGMAGGAEGGVMFDLREEVEHLGVGTARLPDGHVGRHAGAAPPALRLVVENDAGATGSPVRRLPGGAHLRHLVRDPGAGE